MEKKVIYNENSNTITVEQNGRTNLQTGKKAFRLFNRLAKKEPVLVIKKEGSFEKGKKHFAGPNW